MLCAVSDSWEEGGSERAGTRSRSTNKLRFYCDSCRINL